MKIAVFGRKAKIADLDFVKTFFSVLKEEGIDFRIYQDYYEQYVELNYGDLGFQTFTENSGFEPDLLITIGGDGTLLNSIFLTKNGTIPVLGINTGRLGFLTSVSREEVHSAIIALKEKIYVIDSRSLLTIRSKEEVFGNWNYALNECTVLKSESTSMITVQTYIDGEFLNSYWGDGLIISTPTGSTGYSLSCGGPIIAPNSKTIILTPIAPHNLSIRPLVLNDDKVITLKVEGRADHFLCTMDARSVTVPFDTEINLHKASFNLRMVRLKNYSFYKTIRGKLMWGIDKRNEK